MPEVMEVRRLVMRFLKDIWIGTKGLRNGDDFRGTFKLSQITVRFWADAMLRQRNFKVSSGMEKVSPVIVTVGSLGFNEGATFAEICDRAVDRGLKLCPAEFGPQMLLQSSDQPEGKLIIGMQPIVCCDSQHRIFHLEKDGKEKKLVGWPPEFRHSGENFVFLFPN